MANVLTHPLFLTYLLVISLVSFAVMGWDKARAGHPGARRVPERVLFTLALLGGSAGIYGGMYVFHHKTLHRRFVWGIPLILLAQLLLWLWGIGVIALPIR